MEKRIIQVEEKVPVKLLIPLSIQHMFAMFGASVLVPFLFGISPAIVLFMNGIGTLLFIAITKGKAPAYLGSSFAFLAPASIVIQNFGYEYALGGFVAVGFCGCILALIIYKFGTDWINIVLPPAAMGPVVALIGLELSANAASNAGLLDENIDPRKIIVFMVTLGVAVFGSILFRKFLAVIPILIAVLAGYAAAIICGIVDFEEVAAAKIIAMPHFSSPKFDAQAIMIILPVILVIISEHIGHQVVTSKIVGRDLLKDPGLHRSLFGDNFSTMISGLIGQASASALCICAGRRLTNRPSAARRPSSAFSGRFSLGTSSHFGPPTAPSSTESAFLQISMVSSVSGMPFLSIEQPPARTS